jgi:hypothetical protein
LLTTFTKDTELICGDCNDYLLKYVDGKVPTLVFIDPNGYGVPAVRHDIVSKIAKTKNTDVLVTFSWRIGREMGYTSTYLSCDKESCPSPSDISRKFGTCDECTNRIRAVTWKQSLDTWWGHSDWLQWSKLGARGYVEKYAGGLNNGNTIEITAFGRGGDRYYKNDFYLILATKFDLPKYGILKWFRPKK